MFLDHLDNITYLVSKEDYDELHLETDNSYINNIEKLYLTDIGECKVSINGYAGTVPHCEITSKDGSFKTSIKLYKPEYYFRNNTEFSKLTSNQIDDLINYFQTKYPDGTSIHGWTCIRWRNLNSGKIYEHYNEQDSIPDYSKLKDFFKERKINKAIMESMTVKVLDEAYEVNNSYFSGKIFVYGNEGLIPHFHVKYNGKETCFSIFEPMYANHEAHHTTMTHKQLKGLNIFLMSPDRTSETKNKSFWEEIVDDWVVRNNDHNFEHKDDYRKITKPNYEKTVSNRNIGFKYNEKKKPQ